MGFNSLTWTPAHEPTCSQPYISSAATRYASVASGRPEIWIAAAGSSCSRRSLSRKSPRRPSYGVYTVQLVSGAIIALLPGIWSRS